MSFPATVSNFPQFIPAVSFSFNVGIPFCHPLQCVGCKSQSHAVIVYYYSCHGTVTSSRRESVIDTSSLSSEELTSSSHDTLLDALGLEGSTLASTEGVGQTGNYYIGL